MHTISANLKALQDAKNQKPFYLVKIKPSEESPDGEYVDITNIVISGKIFRAVEGEPNTASIDIKSTEGEYDIVNVKSVTNRTFIHRAKVQIYLGFRSEDAVLRFTGYVVEGYKQRYKRGKKEFITIKLQDRSSFLEDPITTDLFKDTLGNVLFDILTNIGGLVSADIDNNLITLLNDYGTIAQFEDESIWDIINMACQVAFVAPLFDVDGVLAYKTIPSVSGGSYLIENNLSFNTANITGTTFEKIEHIWDDDELKSGVIVLGPILSEAHTNPALKVVNVDSNTGYRGNKGDFDSSSMTNGDGNNTFDSLYYDPNASGNDRKYGIGFQGTVVPVFWSGNYDFDDITNLRSNSNNWKLITQGPFPWLKEQFSPFSDVLPTEPYQTTKTGIADDQGATGYFPDYNSWAGTNITIDVSTFYEEQKRLYEPVAQMFETAGRIAFRSTDIFYGILPSRADWVSWQQIATGVSYPAPGDDDWGPTATEYRVYCLTFWSGPADTGDWHPDVFDWMYKVIPWGMICYAGETIAERRATGTAIDSGLNNKYGTSRYVEIENDLIGAKISEGWTVSQTCESIATSMLDNIKIFYLQARFNIKLNLEIEEGDNILCFNPRTTCTERISITSLEYTFERDEPILIELRGGILDSEGTVIKTWE